MPEIPIPQVVSGPTGSVIRSDQNRVVVKVAVAHGCSGCDARRACSGLRLSAAPTHVTAEAVNECAARPGATVVLRLEPGGVAASAALLYLLPASAVVAGAVLGSGPLAQLLGCTEDVAGMVVSGALLFAVLVLLRPLNTWFSRGRMLRLSAVSVLDEGGTG